MRVSIDSINQRQILSSQKKDFNNNSFSYSKESQSKHFNGHSHQKECVSFNYENSFQSPNSLNDRKTLSTASKEELDQSLSFRRDDTMKRITSPQYQDMRINASAFSDDSKSPPQSLDKNFKMGVFSSDSPQKEIQSIIKKKVNEYPQLFSIQIFQSLLEECGFLNSSNEQLWVQFWRMLQYSLQNEQVTSLLVERVLLLLHNPLISIDEKVEEITMILKQTYKQISSSQNIVKELDELGNELAITVRKLATPSKESDGNNMKRKDNLRDQTDIRKQQIIEDLGEYAVDRSGSFTKNTQRESTQSTINETRSFEKSSRIDKNTSAFRQNIDRIQTAPNESAQMKDNSRYKMLFQHAQLLNQKKNSLHLLKEKRELEKCTFQPVFGNQKTPTICLSERIEIYQEKEVHNRLYDQASQLKEKQNEKSNQKLSEKEQEYRQYSFQPQINKQFNYHQYQQGIMTCVPGVKNAIDRVKKARELKDEKEQYWNKKYESCRIKEMKNNPTKIKEFSFLNRRDPLKKEPIMYLDVNVNVGKKGRIALFQGDDSKKVSEDFGKIYKLTVEAVEELERRVEEAFNIYYSQIL